MGVRPPRRMWHIAAALAPLPLIAIGYASKPGNQLTFRLELLMSGSGSVHAQNEAPKGEHPVLPRAAAVLFSKPGKGPRADQYLALKTTTFAGKFISANAAGSLGADGDRLGAKKADLLTRAKAEATVTPGVSSFLDAP